MILISGASGSGKTTVTKELEKLGYSIIPTYTTRPPRPNDYGTICIEPSEFEYMLTHNKFISYHIFNSVMGEVAYGVPVSENPDSYSNSVIILAKEYLEDIIHYITHYTEDRTFLAYINVDNDTIIKNSMEDAERGLANTDLQNRLDRDKDKNNSLKNIADMVIDNSNFKLSPMEIANMISAYYRKEDL